MCVLGLTGCSALHPLKGHPSESLPFEFTSSTRTERKTIDLSLLRQQVPPEHLVDTGDVLGIYIEGILGNVETAPPVFVPNDQNAAPSVGYPIRVDADGTISLPMRDPLPVRGMTISQVRNLVRSAYTTGPTPMMQPNQSRIHVALQKPRTYRVIVIREEASNAQGNRGPASVVNFESDKRGTGRVVNLPAYRNDVLNALTETGGLPGLDAENVVYIARQARQTPVVPTPPAAVPVPTPMYAPASAVSQYGHSSQSVVQASYQSTNPTQPVAAGHTDSFQPGHSQHLLTGSQSGGQFPQEFIAAPGTQPVGWNTPIPYPAGVPAGPSCNPPELMGQTNVVRIPLKVQPGEPLAFRSQDVILQDGDVVFVENRVTEFYYTAGLLGGSQLVLPRDYDIGVMDAIALAEEENRRTLPTSAIGGASVLNQDVTVGASKVIVQRKMPHGGYLPIEVDLYDVMEDPSKQIMIRPEDRIILRYTRSEACLAFFERFFIDGFVTGASNAFILRD